MSVRRIYRTYQIYDMEDGSQESHEQILKEIDYAVKELEVIRKDIQGSLRNVMLTRLVHLVGANPGLGSADIVKEFGATLSNPEILELLQEAEVLGYIYRHKLDPTENNPQGRTVWYSH